MPAQKTSSFQSESSGSQADAELGSQNQARSAVTADPTGQPPEPDQPHLPQYPYTDLRPEARSPVTPDDPGALVGDDATATFDNGPSNPTDRASSEALASATDVARDSTTANDEDMHALHMEDAVEDEHR